MERKIIHIDMDAFYAAIEQRDNPALRGKPVVVGGTSPHSRGVVSTASYEARRFGIHSAMPLKQAYLRCPQAVFLGVNGEKYKRVSGELHRIFRQFTQLVEPISLDEAFLDLTGQDGVAVAREIRDLIASQLDLTASLGVAHNKFLAKLGSDLEKPRGFTVIPTEGVAEFLAPLPIRRIWGIGPRTETHLNGMGIITIGDLQALDREFLRRQFGKWGEEIYQLARGIDHRPVVTGRPPKSLGEEVTFPADITDPLELQHTLWDFAQTLWERLQRNGLLARTITIKVRYADFTTITRSLTLTDPTADVEQLYSRSLLLLERVELQHRKVRLLGLTVGGFIYPGEPYQLSLW